MGTPGHTAGDGHQALETPSWNSRRDVLIIPSGIYSPVVPGSQAGPGNPTETQELSQTPQPHPAPWGSSGGSCPFWGHSPGPPSLRRFPGARAHPWDPAERRDEVVGAPHNTHSHPTPTPQPPGWAPTAGPTGPGSPSAPGGPWEGQEWDQMDVAGRIPVLVPTERGAPGGDPGPTAPEGLTSSPFSPGGPT